MIGGVSQATSDHGKKTCDAMALTAAHRCSGQLSQQQSGGYSQWQRRSCEKVSRSPVCGSTVRSKSATPSPKSHIYSGCCRTTVSPPPCHLRPSDKKRLAAIKAAEQAAAEQRALNERIKLLTLQINCKRRALQESHKREVEILEENIRLKDALDLDEKSAHESAKLLLRKYERLRSSVGSLSNQFTADMQQATQQIDATLTIMTADIKQLDEVLKEVENDVKEKQIEVSFLRNYKAREKPSRDLQIAALERQIRQTACEQQKEVDSIRKSIEHENEKSKTAQQNVLNSIRATSAKEAVSRIPAYVEDSAVRNLQLQQEISLHADECKRLEESIESLRLEVRQLSTGRRSCVRRTVFPELYRVPTGRDHPGTLYRCFWFNSHYHQRQKSDMPDIPINQPLPV